MVLGVRVTRKQTRSKASTSSATRKSRSTGVISSPPDSPPPAVSRASGASRAGMNPFSLDPTESPFHLHSADHPGLVIISLRLDDTNYDDWCVAMRTSLDAKNKIGFIDGSLTRSLESDPNFRLWSRCNSMVKSWLLNTVSPQIYRSILRINDATDIWRDLYGRFHMTNLPRTYNLTQTIQDFRQGNLSLSEYYTQLKTLWDSLDSIEELDDPCTCGKATRLQQKAERAKTVKFLAGLNESYAIVRRQIIAKKALPSLVEVYNIADQDDSQKGFSNVVSSPANAFQVSDITSSAVPQLCYVQNGPKRGRSICSHCNKVGHIAERCYRKHGFPPGFKSKFPNKSQQQRPPLVAAQVSLSSQLDSNPVAADPVSHISKDQLQHFLAMISSHLQSTNSPRPSDDGPSQTAIDHSGSYQGVDDWTG